MPEKGAVRGVPEGGRGTGCRCSGAGCRRRDGSPISSRWPRWTRRGGVERAAAAAGARTTYGTDLVLRTLAMAWNERSATCWSSTSTDDGKQLIYSVRRVTTPGTAFLVVKPGVADAPPVY